MRKVHAYLANVHLLNWMSVVAAIAIGPVFLSIGYAIPGLTFGTAAATYFLCCAIVVPLLTLVAGRLKFSTWQLAIVSFTFTVIGDNLRLGSMHRNEIVWVTYVFWAIGTLLSSPLPIYFLLRPLPRRRRYVFGIAIAAVGLALWLLLKRITG